MLLPLCILLPSHPRGLLCTFIGEILATPAQLPGTFEGVLPSGERPEPSCSQPDEYSQKERALPAGALE